MAMSQPTKDDQQSGSNDRATEKTPSDEMQESIDLLGSSVVRLKQNQMVEGQDAIEELEARYMRLRQDFSAWQDVSGAPRGEPPGSGDPSISVSDKATEALEAARQQVTESYNSFKDYVSDENNQAEFKKRSEEFRDSFGQAWTSVSKSFLTLFDTRDRNEQNADHIKKSN